MENLIEQVPELKLKLNKEHRTIHQNDLAEYPDRNVGDVIQLTWATDPNGNQWYRADIMYYISICSVQDVPELEEVK